MANHKTGAQRYNDRMDKIFDESKRLNEKYHGKDRGLGYKHDGSSYSFPIKKEFKGHPQVKEASEKLKKMASKTKPFGDTKRHPSGRKWRNDDKGGAFESGPYPKAK